MSSDALLLEWLAEHDDASRPGGLHGDSWAKYMDSGIPEYHQDASFFTSWMGDSQTAVAGLADALGLTSRMWNPKVVSPPEDPQATAIHMGDQVGMFYRSAGRSAELLGVKGRMEDDWRAEQAKLIAQYLTTQVSTLGLAAVRAANFLDTREAVPRGVLGDPIDYDKPHSVKDLLILAEKDGLDHVSERVRACLDEWGDEPDQQPLDLESLRHALKFMSDSKDIPGGEIGFGDSGLADLDWRVNPEGMIALVFKSNGRISFAWTVPGDSTGERNLGSGTLEFDRSEPIKCLLHVFLD